MPHRAAMLRETMSDDESVTIDALVERVVRLEMALDQMVAALKTDLTSLRHDLVQLKRARTPAPPRSARPPSSQKPPPKRTISEELAMKTTQRDPRSEK